MTFLIGGFRLTNFGDFRLTVFGQFNPTLTSFVLSLCIIYYDTLSFIHYIYLLFKYKNIIYHGQNRENYRYDRTS